MRHHILIPTDFSDNAWSAALYALKLYSNEPCTFYLLHTWSFKNSAVRTYITSEYLDTNKVETKKRLLEFKDELKAKSTNSDHNFKIIYSTDALLPTIKKAIITHHINLVVMGTKGATGAKEFFFGSNTVNIINKIRLCPILVVPDAFPFMKPKQIAFPTDFNHFYDEEILPIKQLSKLHKSKIRVFHINGEKNLTEKQNYNLAMLKAYLEDYKHSFHWMKDYDKKENAINDFIKVFDINILTMINYKHSFIERIIKEPIIKKIGFQPIIPFLVIPDSD